MAEKRTIIIQDPGTTAVYSVELTESSRTEVTEGHRVTEIIEAVLLEQEPSGLSASDMHTIAVDSVAKLKFDGYIN